MSFVLGIDAAWSDRNPSGVALVESNPPRLIRVAPSFADFVRGTEPGAWCGMQAQRASLGDVLRAAEEIGGSTVTVIAVDMPIAHEPVRVRRACDNAISKKFGAYGCSTHSPTRDRPGSVSDRFLAEAMAAGFRLQTATSDRKDRRALIEVFPHVALLALTGASYRLSYKLSRRRRTWPLASASEQLVRIKQEWTVFWLACGGISRCLVRSLSPAQACGSGRPGKMCSTLLSALGSGLSGWLAERKLSAMRMR